MKNDCVHLGKPIVDENNNIIRRPCTQGCSETDLTIFDCEVFGRCTILKIATDAITGKNYQCCSKGCNYYHKKYS